MEIKIDRRLFLDAIVLGGSLAGLSKVLPISSTVKISFNGTNATIRSTDTESFLKMSTTILNSVEPLDVCVDKRELQNTLSVINDDEVSLVLNDEMSLISVKHAAGEVSIPLFNASVFPSVMVDGDSHKVSVPSDVISTFIGDSSKFVCKNTNLKTFINGVNLYVRNGIIGCASTNKNVIYLNKREVGYDTDFNVSAIISETAFKPLIELCKQDYTIDIDFRDRVVVFTCGCVSFCSRVIDGNYPNLKCAIPENFEHETTMCKDLLIDAIKRIRISLNDAKLTVFNFTNNMLNYSAEDIVYGKRTTEQIPCEGNAEISIGANVEYVSKALSVVQSENVKFRLAGNIRPFEVLDDSDADKLVLIAPMTMIQN